jgi:hypothetical protein
LVVLAPRWLRKVEGETSTPGSEGNYAPIDEKSASTLERSVPTAATCEAIFEIDAAMSASTTRIYDRVHLVKSCGPIVSKSEPALARFAATDATSGLNDETAAVTYAIFIAICDTPGGTN